jgi:hypothetical protein
MLALSMVYEQWIGCLESVGARVRRLYLGGSRDARLGGRVRGLRTGEGIGWMAAGAGGWLPEGVR